MQDEKEKLLKTLAERIAEEQQKKQGWEQTTLSGGLPGICLLLGKLMELYPGEERFVKLARGCLGQCVSYLNEHGTFSSSMFSGLAGMGLGAYCVSNGGRDYQKLIKTITGGVIEGVEKGIAEICQGSGTHCLFYDTMEGISGMLSYLTLFAEDEKVRAILEKGAQALIFLTREITVLGYQVPGWHLPAEKQFSREESLLFPDGNFNTSLSHGIGGPLAVLARLFEMGIRVQGHREALERILAFYQEFCSTDGEQEFWKGQLDFHEVAEHRLTDQNIVRRDAWCYGSFGICYAMLLAGKALGRQEIITDAIRQMRQALTEIHGIFSPTLCHGYAGIYAVLQGTEQELQKPLFGEEKEELLEKIWSYYDPAYSYGFYNYEFDRTSGELQREEDLGLLNGAAGVCLTLLEAAHPGKNPWKKAFLIG